MNTYKRVLSIAGSDSGGGAGIQADIKTISACGCYAMTAITAITVQNTLGVSDIHIIPTDIVEKQIIAVIEDIGVDAVKLGMLPTAEVIVSIAGLLKKYNVRNIVMDPVIISTSGHRLISSEAADAIVKYILPISTIITPNIPESEYLSKTTINKKSDFAAAAAILKENGASSVLIKSGHLAESSLSDYLFKENGEVFKYDYARIETPNTHGTGCTLSSAIASYLALGFEMEIAVQMAEDYIHEAIVHGDDYRLGEGHGPVHHFYKFWE